MRFPRFASALTVLAAPVLLSACADPAPLYVDRAWVQINPNDAGPASGYFTIHGGAEPTRLLSVTTEGAQRIEMHESIEKNGMMTMQAVESVDVPAKSKVEFAPGGKHLMIFGVNPAIVETGKLTMTMFFANGDRLIVDAVVRKAGAATGGQQAAGNAAGAAGDGGNSSEHAAH